MAGKGASLKPSDMLSGGRVPDGRYTIKSATAEIFNYGGQANDVPAACLVLKSVDDGTEHEQYYSAGDLQYLVPSEDKTEFVHPRGEEAKFSQNTNFGKFVKALLGAGFPESELTSKLTCLVAADIQIVGQAQPKNQSGKETVLALPTKYHGKGKAQRGAAPTRPTPVVSKPTSTASAGSVPAATSNGDVDEQAREQVMAALAEADGNTLTRKRLYTVVMTSVAALKKDRPDIPARPEVFANLVGITKAVNNPTWLAAQAEAGGWTVEGDNVRLG